MKFPIQFMLIFVFGVGCVTAQTLVKNPSASVPILKSAHLQEGMKVAQSENKSWRLLLFEFGLGYGSGSDIGFGKADPGLVGSMEAFTFAFGFNSLKGLGFGTTLFEMNLGPSITSIDGNKEKWSIEGHPHSLFPVYAFFPLFSQKRSIAGLEARSPFIYLFGGGSLWGSQSNYVHAGIGANLLTWEIVDVDSPPPSSFYGMLADMIISAFPTYNIGFKAGFFYTAKRTVEFDVPFNYSFEYGFPGKLEEQVGSDWGVYLTLRFGLGLAFQKRKNPKRIIK